MGSEWTNIRPNKGGVSEYKGSVSGFVYCGKSASTSLDMECVADMVKAVKRDYLFQISEKCGEVSSSYGKTNRAIIKALAKPVLHLRMRVYAPSQRCEMSLHNTQHIKPYVLQSPKDAPVAEVLWTLLETDPDIICVENDARDMGPLMGEQIVREYTFGAPVAAKVAEGYNAADWVLPFMAMMFMGAENVIDYKYGVSVMDYICKSKVDGVAVKRIIPKLDIIHTEIKTLAAKKEASVDDWVALLRMLNFPESIATSSTPCLPAP